MRYVNGLRPPLLKRMVTNRFGCRRSSSKSSLFRKRRQRIVETHFCAGQTTSYPVSRVLVMMEVNEKTSDGIAQTLNFMNAHLTLRRNWSVAQLGFNYGASNIRLWLLLLRCLISLIWYLLLDLLVWLPLLMCDIYRQTIFTFLWLKQWID